MKTTVEAESTDENGPGGTYSSWDVFDARGLNVWSVAADGASTTRLYDNDHAELPTMPLALSVSLTGSVVRTIRNASRSGDGLPSSDVPTGLPADRNADGGSLTTTVVRDVLGRVQQSLSAGGVGRTTTREMRTSPSRPNLLYKAGRPEEGTILAEPGYDFLDRPKFTSVSTDGATGSPKWTVVSRNHYDSVADGDDDTDGVGNGNLTVTRMPLDESLANDRVYRHAHDFRGRRVSTTSPTSPHEIVEYDNLDRIVGRALVAGSAAPTTIDLDSADSARRSLSRTTYSQRGVAIRQETAIDPTLASSSRTYLASNSWLDAVGRTVGSWSPSSPATKTTYDGLGRTTTTYITDRGGDANPQPPPLPRGVATPATPTCMRRTPRS